MSDYTHTPIGSGYNSNANINTEFSAIETSNNSKLDKSGGTLTGDLDLNSNEVLNVADAVTAKGAVNLSQLNNATFQESEVSTTVGLISSLGASSPAKVDGYTSVGDGGDGIWILNGTTNQTASQSPVQLTDALLNDASGNQWALVLPAYLANAELNPEVLGAAGDKTTDDLAVLDVCRDYLDGIGGGILNLPKAYRITATFNHNGGGVKYLGVGIKNIFNDTVAAGDNSVIYADFTSGPVMLVSDGAAEMEGFTIEGSATRSATTITTGVRGSNSGVLIEPLDDGTDIIQNAILKNIRIVKQPADGVLIEGDVTNVTLDNVYTATTGRHGITITEGDIGGRTNTTPPGIIVINKGKSFDCGGHGMAIGHPSSSQFPYRITGTNREGYRLATDSGERHGTSGNFIVAQNSTFTNCAWAGTTTGNTPDHEGVEVGGRDVSLIDSRFINCQTNYVVIRQQSGFTTKNLKIDGGTSSTTGATAPADFASLASGPDGVRIVRVEHDGANPITDLTVSATNNDILLHDIDENKTVYHNHTEDFTETTLEGLHAIGSTLTIASGEITVTKQGYYKIDTEGAASTDTLTTINGGIVGDVIYLQQTNSGRVITIDHGAGNIRLSGALDFTYSSTVEFAPLMYNGTNWYQAGAIINNS
ncbi:MAG: hypothetical protein OCD76_07400 [Reichenbachiella sp.]